MQAILHNIRSIHNVGSMFRTADAAGIEKLYLTGITPTPVDEWGRVRPQFAKVSLGAEETVPWEKHASATRLIKKLKKGGYRIFAVEQHQHAVSLAEFCAKKPYSKISGSRFYCTLSLTHTVLVMGNEVRGLSSAILKHADHIVGIPMRGKKESLNVAVAFGIVAYSFLLRK